MTSQNIHWIVIAMWTLVLILKIWDIRDRYKKNKKRKARDIEVQRRFDECDELSMQKKHSEDVSCYLHVREDIEKGKL